MMLLVLLIVIFLPQGHVSATNLFNTNDPNQVIFNSSVGKDSASNSGIAQFKITDRITITSLQLPDPQFRLYLPLILGEPEISLDREYYVSPSGNDDNPGTRAQPYRTIQHAVDLANNPGDTVLVMSGEYISNSTYNSDAIIIENKNGSPGNEIVIRAYDPNNKPVIINRSGGFRVINSSYLIIDGFEIKDYLNAGIALYVSTNITIKNNNIHHTFEGVCQPGEGLPKCKSDGTSAGQVKGRKDNFGNFILENDGKQNTGVYLCKSQNNSIANNKIESTDEGIYVGSAGNVQPESCWTNYSTRTWSSGNIIENNIIVNSMNEGIELKPDAIRTIVNNNLLKNASGFEIGAIEIRSAYNDVFENVVFGDNQYSKTGIRMVNESACTNPPNDEFGNSMSIYPGNTGYTCSFENNIHNNYIYYSQGNNYIPAIYNHSLSAANSINHNTIVGGNDFGIISDAAFSTISNNLVIGSRGNKNSLLTQISSKKPLTSDFNAYYPKNRTNGGCILNIAGATVVCETGQNTTYEVNSIFMDSSPTGSFQPATSPIKIDSECSITFLSTLTPEILKDVIKICSLPLDNSFGNLITNKASDGTNIGAVP